MPGSLLTDEAINSGGLRIRLQSTNPAGAGRVTSIQLCTLPDIIF
jgi:hypothetical protein